MKNQKMKIGFIGCGGFASGNHIPNVVANPNFEIKAFCDLNEEQLKNLDGLYRPEEKTDNCTTDTIPIPIMDVERKTLPVFCPWCRGISGVANPDVVRSVKISPHGYSRRKSFRTRLSNKDYVSLGLCLY